MEILKKLFSGKTLVLASGSPRRQSLFRLLDLDFQVYVSRVNEEIRTGLSPDEIVLELADRKARTAAKAFENALVVGADTIVVLNKRILGKPKDRADAARMLRTLSGKTHEVYTGYKIISLPENEGAAGYEKTAVTFKELQDDEIDAYIATGSPLDKAGAYGIQDAGAVFVKHIDGCFYNVMGFPLSNFYRTCRVFFKQKHFKV